MVLCERDRAEELTPRVAVPPSTITAIATTVASSLRVRRAREYQLLTDLTIKAQLLL